MAEIKTMKIKNSGKDVGKGLPATPTGLVNCSSMMETSIGVPKEQNCRSPRSIIPEHGLKEGCPYPAKEMTTHPR